MTTRQLWIAGIATLSVAACSKPDTRQAPMTKPVEATQPVETTKPVEVGPAVAPTPAPAPAVAPRPSPAKAATKHETEALALLHEIARKTLTTDRFDPTRAFALVDLSTKPAGDQRHVIKGLCASAEDGLEVLDGLGRKLHADAAQLEGAFANDAVTCTTKSADLVSCEVRAHEAGKATLTYLIWFAKGRVVPVGYARRETVMTTNKDRLAADDKTIEDAFAKLGKKSCL